MSKNFWDIFLPEDIIIVSARYNGKDGTATIKFLYHNSNVQHIANFTRVKVLDREVWTLDEIK